MYIYTFKTLEETLGNTFLDNDHCKEFLTKFPTQKKLQQNQKWMSVT